MGRDGVTPEMAKAAVRRSQHADRRDAGAPGRCRRACCAARSAGYEHHLEHVAQRHRPASRARSIFAAMNALMLEERTLFICDTYVNEDPTRGAAGRDRRCWPPTRCGASA